MQTGTTKHRKPLPPLTLGIVRKIYTVTGVDLLKAGDPRVAVLLEDPIFLGQAIGLLMGREDIGGAELDRLAHAFQTGLLEFFPKRSVFDDFTDQDQRSEAGEVDPWRIVFKAAGIAGVDPWAYSFREILWMAQGAFEPYAIQIAIELDKGKKKNRPATDPEILNPYHPKRQRRKRSRNNAGTNKD